MNIFTDNLSKMSNKSYSEAVIGQFKTLFCLWELISIYHNRTTDL